MEIKREVDSYDIAECQHDDMLSTGMLGFSDVMFLPSIVWITYTWFLHFFSGFFDT